MATEGVSLMHSTTELVTFQDTPSGPRAALRHQSGAKCFVYFQGAHVADWVTAAGHQPLYVSPAAVYVPGKPLRGGIPVCWPQFSDMGSLPQHGLLRTNACFTIHRTGANDDVTSLTLRTVSDDHTKAQWPHTFEFLYTVELSPDTLVCKIDVTNIGPAPWPFTCALHTYLSVSDITRTAVVGLGGAEYLDNLKQRQLALHPVDADPFFIGEEVDRIYLNVPKPIQVRDEVTGVTVDISAAGFPDTVLWNPWEAKCASIADLPDDGYRHFVCVESAAVGGTDPSKHPSLAVGATWSATLTLAAR